MLRTKASLLSSSHHPQESRSTFTALLYNWVTSLSEAQPGTPGTHRLSTLQRNRKHPCGHRHHGLSSNGGLDPGFRQDIPKTKGTWKRTRNAAAHAFGQGLLRESTAPIWGRHSSLGATPPPPPTTVKPSKPDSVHRDKGIPAHRTPLLCV